MSVEERSKQELYNNIAKLRMVISDLVELLPRELGTKKDELFELLDEITFSEIKRNETKMAK